MHRVSLKLDQETISDSFPSKKEEGRESELGQRSQNRDSVPSRYM